MVMILLVFLFLLAGFDIAGQKNNKPNDTPFQMEWPIKSKQGEKISSTFAESRYDHFHNGLDIPVDGFAVSPIHDGEVLWVRTSYKRLNEVPFGGGNTIILKHKNIWSGYMHLKEIKPEIISQRSLSTRNTIGLSGKTGHSGGAHLHFFVFDSKNSTFYNPLLFDQKKIIKDVKPPLLKSYSITSYAKDKAANKIPDDTLLAHIEDQGVGSERWGIYYLRVYNQEGETLKTLKFDSIQWLNENWVVSGQTPFDQVYHGKKYILNDQSGEKIKWQAGGFSGPSLTKSYEPSK